MSRNLIFNPEFKNFIIPGNFQEFSGTLDIDWNWPIFCQFWHIGHIFHLIFVTELEFGLNDWKMSFFLIISSNFWIWIPGFQKWPGIGIFELLRPNWTSVRKIKWNRCPIWQKWQKLAISRQYPEFQKIPGCFQEWWNV